MKKDDRLTELGLRMVDDGVLLGATFAAAMTVHSLRQLWED